MSLLLDAVTKGVPRSQPTGNASINWDHPLSKSMTFDMTASVGPVNNVTGAFATSKTGASTIATPMGLGYGVSQSSGNCILFSTQVILNTYPFSILFIADTVAEANRKFVFQFGQDTGSAAARVWVLFNGTATGGSSSDSSGKLYLYTIDTGLNQNSPAAGGLAGAIISGVHSYGITRDASTVSYYRDGKLLGTESPTNSNNVWTTLGITSVNGVSPNLSNVREFDRSLILTRFWNGRLLSEQDFQSLYQNPWQIYSSRTRDKWITPTIAAGGDVSVNATALSLSIAAQAPTETGTAVISPTAQSLTLAQQAPVINGSATVSPNAQALSLSLQSPSVTTDGSVSVSTTALNLSVSIQAPVENGGCSVSPTAQPLAFTLRAPTISINASVTPSVLAMVATAYGPVMHGDGAVTPTLQQLVINAFGPTVSVPGGVANTPSHFNSMGVFINGVSKSAVFLGEVSPLGVFVNAVTTRKVS